MSIGISGAASAVSATASISITNGYMSANPAPNPNGYPNYVAEIAQYRIQVTDAKSYTLSINTQTTNTDLTSTTTTDKIISISSDLLGSNFPMNTWGYCRNGTGAYGICNTTNDIHSPIPSLTSPVIINTANLTKDNNYAADIYEYITYGIKYNISLESATYTNTIVYSLTAEDRELFDGITYMQEMTKTVCDSEPIPSPSDLDVPTKQLIDKRDNKKYWIAKLADGNCWMTQNLDLDLSTSTTLTPEDSDLATDWTPTVTTLSTNYRNNDTSQTSIQSYDVGYRIMNTPNSGITCNLWVTDITACSDISSMSYVGPGSGYTDGYVATGTGDTQEQINASLVAIDSTSQSYDAHYLLGNYYSWNAATAGTGGTITDTKATSSICPKGWHLPMSSSTDNGSFGYLMDAYNLPSTNTGITVAQSNKLSSAPLYLFRNGDAVPGSLFGLSNIGRFGAYWSNTADSTTSNVYSLYHDVSFISSSSSSDRFNGFAIRCIADGQKELNDLTYMQDMTNDVCRATRTPSTDETLTVPTKQLIDSRDNKKYWVAKLADGHCWMTQNLALNLSTSTTLTPNNTNISTNWTPSTSTTNNNNGMSTSNTVVQSWYFGDYVINNPNAGTNLCPSAVSTLTACSGISNMTNVSEYADDYIATGEGVAVQAVDTSTQKYDAHYLLGIYYSWNAATAGTGGSLINSRASSSICPKGWILPEGSQNNESTRKLFGAYELPTDTSITATTDQFTKLGSAPFYFIASGILSPYNTDGLDRIGVASGYQTSQASPTADRSQIFSYHSTLFQHYGAGSLRNHGFPIRCML